MKLKPVLRYQLLQYRTAFFCFYGLIYFFMAVVLILKYARHFAWSEVSGGCLEGITMLACFIGGIALFKGAFRFFTSCSVSRKQFFFSFAAAIAIIAAVVSLIDMVNAVVFSHFIDYRTNYSSMLAGDFVITDKRNEIASAVPFTFPVLMKNWLWCLLADFALGMLGFLIAALYYRLSRPVKILVSVGVPAFFLLFIPLLDANVTHNSFGRFFMSAWTQWTHWGLNPGLDLLSRLAVVALFGGGVWLLLRKAELYR